MKRFSVILLVSILLLSNISNASTNEGPSISILQDRYSISGKVGVGSLDVPGICSGFKIQLFNGDEVSSAVTGADGSFKLNDIPKNPNSYILRVTKDGFLDRELTIYDFNKDIDLSGAVFNMMAGDIPVDGVKDGIINMIDVFQIAKCFDTKSGDLLYNKSADFNCDNTINMNDLIIIALNFNAIKGDYLPNKATTGSLDYFYRDANSSARRESSAETSSVTDVTSKSAVFNGSANIHYGSCIAYSAYYETENPSVFYIGDSLIISDSMGHDCPIKFSMKINGLKKNTNYTCMFFIVGNGWQSSDGYKSIEITTLDK